MLELAELGLGAYGTCIMQSYIVLLTTPVSMVPRVRREPEELTVYVPTDSPDQTVKSVR